MFCSPSGAWLVVGLLLGSWLVLAAESTFVFEANVMVPMRDGVKLAANVWRPKAEGRYPVVLLRSPYGKMDENWGDAKRYTQAGYVMVTQDCRGRGQSEGVWDPFAYDVEDGFDTQEWVGQQPWCNGKIGTAGGSYVGWTQWASVAKASPYLKAMVPVVPFENAYEVAYYGGAMQLSLLMGWGALVGGATVKPEQAAEVFRHLPLNTFGDQFEKKVGYLNDWVAHPTYDDYWKKRSLDHQYAEVTVPILNIGGWYDIFPNPRSKCPRGCARNPGAGSAPQSGGGDRSVGARVGGQKVGELDFGAAARFSTGDWQFKWLDFWLKATRLGAGLAGVPLVCHGRKPMARRERMAAQAHAIHRVLSAQRRQGEFAEGRRDSPAPPRPHRKKRMRSPTTAIIRCRQPAATISLARRSGRLTKPRWSSATMCWFIPPRRLMRTWK